MTKKVRYLKNSASNLKQKPAISEYGVALSLNAVAYATADVMDGRARCGMESVADYLTKRGIDEVPELQLDVFVTQH